tara:strand:- start:610 stop:816 length:207 start_codon:yes stop_codon:yes gene_type:complete
MKKGDLVTDDFYEQRGIIISGPRISKGCEHVAFGTMDGDVYEVVDVLCTDGTLKLFTTGELRVVNESR